MQFCDILHLGDTANANITTGVNIQQGSADTQVFALKSSDVAHTMTNTAEADTYGHFSKYQGVAGGLRINGYIDTDAASGCHSALVLAAFITDCADTTKTTAGNGVVTIDVNRAHGGGSYGGSGSSADVNTSDGNMLTIRNEVTTRFIFDTEGTAHADVGTATYDDYCDVELLRGLLATTCDQYKQNYVDKFGQDLMYNQEWYEDNKLIGKCSIHYETRECGRVQQRAMVNFTGLTMLHHSTIIQMADRFSARLDGIETQLKALSEGK
jgi:hypothetical protein